MWKPEIIWTDIGEDTSIIRTNIPSIVEYYNAWKWSCTYSSLIHENLEFTKFDWERSIHRDEMWLLIQYNDEQVMLDDIDFNDTVEVQQAHLLAVKKAWEYCVPVNTAGMKHDGKFYLELSQCSKSLIEGSNEKIENYNIDTQTDLSKWVFEWVIVDHKKYSEVNGQLWSTQDKALDVLAA